MKCEICGNPVERKFKVYIPVKDKEDAIISCCGRCKLLCDINDNLTALVKKQNNACTPSLN